MSTTNIAPAVNGEGLRAAMRRVPSSVTVVTIGGERPRGITIGSFDTVSLDPPLVSFNVQRKARIHDDLRAEVRFAVHILSGEQAHLSDTFADPDMSGPDQLAKAEAIEDSQGVPVLEGVVARFECTIQNVYAAGDHSILVGSVDSLTTNGGDALLYMNRAYYSLVEGDDARQV